jgi:5-methyltetrahydrofolate--homocysteine methyltransferase
MQAMLQLIVNENLLQARAVIGFWKANSVGDDIELYDDNGKTVATLFGLRQQTEKDSDEHYYCLSDFIAPKDSGITDHIGMFVTSCGHGCEELCKKVRTLT